MMNTSTIDLDAVINQLIEICHDGEQGFAAAAEAPDDPRLKNQLLRYSRQRLEFGSQLEKVQREPGEKPVSRGSASGAMHRGWMDIKASMTRDNTHAVLAECERGEDAAVDAYRQAVASSLPGSIETLVTTQYQAVERAHDRIRSLRDAAKPA
jgi:uncharacterized protein (TIGR02284 family)